MIIKLIIYFFLIFFISKYFNNKQILSNFSGDKHQIFSNDKNIPLIGGFLLLYPLLFLIRDYNLLFVFCLLIFSVGLLSDLKILNSPKAKILIQVVLILLFVILSEIKINSSRLDFFDLLLENIYFTFFFSSFCILILINGSNFIDGLNGLLLGYTLLVVYFLNDQGLLPQIGFKEEDILFLFFALIVLLIFNFNNKIMLGDSGAYYVGLFLGYTLIESHNQNILISPYFFIVLIWYPCFENLFSIIRKFFIKKSPANPDKFHLHHLLFLSIKKRLKLNKISSNNISSVLINLVNLFIFFIASYDPYNTKFQIFIIMFSMIIYILSYLFLFKNSKSSLRLCK